MILAQLSMFASQPNGTYWIVYRDTGREMEPLRDDDGEVRRFESADEAEKERGWFDVVAARRDDEHGQAE